MNRKIIILLLLLFSWEIKAITLKELESKYISIVRGIKTSVVNVIVEKERESSIVNNEEIISPLQFYTKIVGAGIVFDNKGHVVTPYSTVKDAYQIKVITGDKEHFAELLAFDELSDIAVLKVDGLKVKPIPWGDSDFVEEGNFIITIGSSYQNYFSINFGILTSFDRNIEIGPLDRYLFFSAPLKAGDKGGALINLEGECIGMILAQLSEKNNREEQIKVGVAIPWNNVIEIAQELITNGYVIRGWLGINVLPYNYVEVGDEIRRGLLINKVYKNSPAYKAGIRPGDIIVNINDQVIKDFYRFKKIVSNSKIGEQIKLKVLRNGVIKDLYVKLTEEPYKELKITYELTKQEKKELDLMKLAEFIYGKKVSIDYIKADHIKRKKLAHFFWAHYPPGAREEILLKMKYVNEKFSTLNNAGIETDKGRVYLKYGPPDEVVSIQSMHQKSLLISSENKIDIWYYYNKNIAFKFGNDNNFLNKTMEDSSFKIKGRIKLSLSKKK